MKLTKRALVLLGLCACALVPLSAQTAQNRELQRFWIHVDLGYGTANVSCDLCASGPRLGGVTYGVELGGTLNPNVRLGGAFEAWTHGTGSAAEDMENLGVVMYYYPTSSGLFVKGLVGLSTYHAAGFPAISGTGWGATAGIGYEVPIGRSATIIPFADYVLGNVGDLSYDDGTPFATGWSQNFVAIGLSFGFYPSARHRY